MNKFSIALATPAVFIIADWAAHENEKGYNTGLARALSMLFIFAALGVFLKGQYDLGKKQKNEADARAEAIRVILQKSIDKNLNKGN